jgi:hypothetical protein
MTARFSLAAAVVALVTWALLVATLPATMAAMHLLLALGTTLLVYWWALTR